MAHLAHRADVLAAAEPPQIELGVARAKCCDGAACPALLELFEFIRSENIKSLIAHFGQEFAEEFSVRYPPTRPTPTHFSTHLARAHTHVHTPTRARCSHQRCPSFQVPVPLLSGAAARCCRRGVGALCCVSSPCLHRYRQAIDHVPTFKGLVLKYEQSIEGTADGGGAGAGDAGDGARQGPKHGVGGQVGAQGRGLNKSEEDYFNESDSDEDETTSSSSSGFVPGQSAVPGPAAASPGLLSGLSQYGDDDDDEDDASGDSGGLLSSMAAETAAESATREAARLTAPRDIGAQYRQSPMDAQAGAGSAQFAGNAVEKRPRAVSPPLPVPPGGQAIGPAIGPARPGTAVYTRPEASGGGGGAAGGGGGGGGGGMPPGSDEEHAAKRSKVDA